MPRRGILIKVSILTGAFAGAVALGLWLSQPGLPPPRLANRDQLVAWMVGRDLGLEPPGLRRELVRRLEQEFQGGVPWDDTARKLSQTQRRQLWDNVPVLLEAWLLDKVEAYGARAGQQRLALLDEAIATFKGWQGAAVLRPGHPDPDPAGGGDAGLSAVLHERVEALCRESAPAQRRQIEQFVAAVRARWLWHGLTRGG